MRALLLTVVVLGCHRDELGSTPQLFGKLANISVHDTEDQVEAVDWHLATGRKLDDGALSYRVDFDSTHHVRDAIIWSKASIDEITGSWGDGVSGRDRKRFYFDPLQRTRYELSGNSEGFTLDAMPYRPIDDILGTDDGVNVFGIDLFALAPDAVMPALADKLVSTSRLAVERTTVFHTENGLASDVGDVRLVVDTRADVASYSLEIYTEPFVDGRERVHALLERKWGPPQREGNADIYRSTHASRIRVRERDDFVDIEVDR